MHNPPPVTLEAFRSEIARLVRKFEAGEASFKHVDYAEDRVRTDFLDPLWIALGWDRANNANKTESERDVVSESGVRIAGNKKRADYLFRTDRKSRFVCEAKKPREDLKHHAFQAKRYAWNLQLPVALLTDFEDIQLFVVGECPKEGEGAVGLAKHWNYRQFEQCAEEIWGLLAFDRVRDGSLEAYVESLPKRLTGKKRGGFAVRPDRTKAVDSVFLDELETARAELGKSIFRLNDRARLAQGNLLNESVQRILDRVLFLRICEARGIDTGQSLEDICRNHSKSRDECSAYQALVEHFRELSRSRSVGVPYFNGSLFSPHPSEDIRVGNDWMLGFISRLSGEKSPYMFDVIPIEILGSIYERFLGSLIVPSGRGVKVVEKPEVRKAGGVYYTPRYIVDYIVEQTLGKRLDAISTGDGGVRPSLDEFERQTSALRVLDPACGSGSFLIRAYERLCEHWERRLQADLPARNDPQRAAWERSNRSICWVDATSDHILLTVGLKRRILLSSIYGVDIDQGAVEVTQLSLYLKMLEHETKTSLENQRILFGGKEPLLPGLGSNIKCGNSLIEPSDLLDSEGMAALRAFDWRIGFDEIIKSGGFDFVLGNPPWGQKAVGFSEVERECLRARYAVATGILDLFKLFCERSLLLVRSGGTWGMVLPDVILLKNYPETRKFILESSQLTEIAHAGMAFDGVNIDTVCLIAQRTDTPQDSHQVSIIREFREGTDWRSGQSQTKLSQGTFRTLRDYKFNIYLEPSSIALLQSLSALPRLADRFEAHEGVHSGNVREKLFVDAPTSAACRKLIFGRDELSRYGIRWAGRWIVADQSLLRRRQGEYANLGRPEYFEREKILIRRTGDFVMAALDRDHYYCSNNMFVLYPIDLADAVDLRAMVAILNSRLITWYFRTIQPRVGKVFAELKINQLAEFPIPCPIRLAESQPRLCQLHDMISDVKQRMAVPNAASEELAGNQIASLAGKIDELVFDLYRLGSDDRSTVQRAF